MTKYFVVEGNTLVYQLPNAMAYAPLRYECGILQASIIMGSRFSPNSFVYLNYVEHRTATARDFEMFKVTLPPDYGF